MLTRRPNRKQEEQKAQQRINHAKIARILIDAVPKFLRRTEIEKESGLDEKTIYKHLKEFEDKWGLIEEQESLKGHKTYKWWDRSVFFSSKKIATESYNEILHQALSRKSVCPKFEIRKGLFIVRGIELENVEIQGLYDGAIISLGPFPSAVSFGTAVSIESYPLEVSFMHKCSETVAADILDEANVEIKARALTLDGGYCSVYGFIAPIPPDMECKEIVDAKPRLFSLHLPDKELKKLEQIFPNKTTHAFKIGYEILLLGRPPSKTEIEGVSKKFNVEKKDAEKVIRKLKKKAFFPWL